MFPLPPAWEVTVPSLLKGLNSSRQCFRTHSLLSRGYVCAAYSEAGQHSSDRSRRLAASSPTLETKAELVQSINTVLRHTVSVGGNFCAFKDLLTSRNWNTALGEGDNSVEVLEARTNESVLALFGGAEPLVLTKINPVSSTEVPNHTEPNLEGLMNPGQPVGPENRPLSEVLSQASKSLLNKQIGWKSHSQPLSYQPSGLLHLLRTLAEEL